MAKLYLKKIKNGELNIATGEAWELKDVPVLWRVEVEELLNAENPNQ